MCRSTGACETRLPLSATLENQLIMRIQHLALMGTLLIAGASAAQAPSSAEGNRQLPVTVIVANDYPAFSPAPGTPGQPLRALVLLQVPGGGDATVILLNPAHANAHTLYEALSIVRRRAGVPRRDRVAAIGMAPGVRVPMGAVASRLESIIAALRSADSRAERYRIRGATTEIADAREFFRPEPRP